jgi:hypothetical protein
VLGPDAALILSSHSSVGGVLTPHGLRSGEAWRTRVGALRGAGKDRFRDGDGAMIHHARPSKVIGEVESMTGLRSAGVWATRSGRTGVAARVFSAWPTYLFVRGHAGR